MTRHDTALAAIQATTNPLRTMLVGQIDNARRMHREWMRRLTQPVPWVWSNPEAYRAECRRELASVAAQIVQAEHALAVWDTLSDEQQRGVGVFNPADFAGAEVMA